MENYCSLCYYCSLLENALPKKKTKKNILIQNKYLIKLIVRLFKNKCLVFSLLYQTYKLKNKIVTKLFGRPKITLNGLKTRRWINRNVNHN